VVTAFAIAGLDPVLTLFSWLTNTATLGVLGLMALASVAVPAFFQRRGLPAPAFMTVLAPIASGAALIAVLVLAVANFGLLTGASPALAVLLPASLAVAALVGVLLGLARRRNSTAQPTKVP
jgi:hypothetical protein